MNGNTYHIKLREGTNFEDAIDKFSALPEVQKAEPVNIIQMPYSESELSRPAVPSSTTSETSAKPDVQPTAVPPVPSVIAKETPVKPGAQPTVASPVPSSVTKETFTNQKSKAVMVLPVEEKKYNGQNKELLSVAQPKVVKNGKYAIQIKAYPEAEKKDVKAFVEDLKKTQQDVYVERVKIRKRGVWYRILTGHFASIEDATNYMKEKKISEAHPGSFVQQKSEGRSSKPKPE